MAEGVVFLSRASLKSNLIDAVDVSSALKVGGEESLDNVGGFSLCDETARHDEYIGVVVLAGESGYLGHPNQGGAYHLMFVERHRNAFAAATNGNAALTLAVFHSAGQGMAIVRIVAAVGGIGAIINGLYTLLFQQLGHKLFEGEAGVVAGQSDFCHIYNIIGLCFVRKSLTGQKGPIGLIGRLCLGEELFHLQKDVFGGVTEFFVKHLEGRTKTKAIESVHSAATTHKPLKGDGQTGRQTKDFGIGR